MKKYHVILTVLFCVFIAGCSLIGTKTPPKSVLGTWNGTANDGSPATMVFKDDNTMTLALTIEGYDIYLVGNYEVDYSTDPVAVDLNALELSEFDMTLYCPGIAAFPEPAKMIFYGMMGESSGGQHPTEFNTSPSQMGEFYLDLSKEE